MQRRKRKSTSRTWDNDRKQVIARSLANMGSINGELPLIDRERFCREFGIVWTDKIWDFDDAEDTVNYDRSRCIDWTGLPEDMVEDLRTQVVVRIKYPVAAGINIKNTLPKIKTVVSETRLLIRVLRSWLNDANNHLASNLGDLDDQDLDDLWALTSSGQLTHMKVILRFLTNPFYQANCRHPVRWNDDDLSHLSIHHQPESFEPLPVDQTFFIDNVATQDILSFLTAMDKPILDKEHQLRPETDSWGHMESAREKFEDYLQVAKAIHKYGSSSLKYKAVVQPFDTKYGQGWLSRVGGLIDETAQSALMLVALNVPGRDSDWNVFRKDVSLQDFRGVHILRGNNIKVAPDAPELCEVWPIAPHVVDAVHCLEEILRMKQSDYLFQPYGNVQSSGGISPSLWGDRAEKWYLRKLKQAKKDKWITTNDKGEERPTERLNAYRFRHTLPYIFQMAGLGQAECSYLLKHTISGHKQLDEDFQIARQTGLYGRTLYNMVDIMTQAEERARTALFEEMINPDAAYAGEHAQARLERIRQVYEATISEWDAKGKVHDGKNSVIKAMMLQGYTFVDVGVGQCMGTDLSSGYLPPCKESSKCSPRHCKNSVIAQRHAKPIQWDTLEIFKRNHTHGFPWGLDARETVLGHLQSLIELDRLEPEFLDHVRAYDGDGILEGLLAEARQAIAQQRSAGNGQG